MLIISLTWYEITSLVLTIVIVYYVAFLLWKMYSIIYFKKKLDSYMRPLKVVVAEKIDITKLLIDLCRKNNIDTGNVIPRNRLSSVDPSMTISSFYKETDKFFRKLYRSVSTIENIGFAKELATIKKFADENSALYNQVVEDYNSNLGGYNYWVNFIIGRWLVKLCKFKKRESIY
ncbi:MAG: hypothetical protein RR342_02585 [Bacilli bacterium]